MDELQEIGQEILPFLPLLIPIFLVQIALIVIALWDLWKREATRGPKWLWVLVILLINFIGPIIYLVVGREDE
jgi:hypothetical protein